MKLLYRRIVVNPAAGLPARVYYVKVSGIESDGVTDCLPQQRDCLVHWSNALRLRVR